MSTITAPPLAPLEIPLPDLNVRREQRMRWESVAADLPDFFNASSTQYYRRCEIALIRRCFGPLQGKRVLKLDLWNEAINTRILNWMRSEGCEAFGIDISSRVTSRARDNARNGDQTLHLAQSDVRQIPFADNSFDFVYTMGTIEHFEEYAEAVSEIRRVLKIGGRAIVGVPHKWNIFGRPLIVRALELFDRYPYAPEKSFSAGELRRVVEGSGLRVRRRSGILTIPGLLRMADLFFYRRNIPLHRLTPLFLWPFDRIERRWEWPGRFGYLLAILAEKA